MIDFDLFNAYICIIHHGADCGCSQCQIDSAFINNYPRDKYSIQMALMSTELKRRTQAMNDKSILYDESLAPSDSRP